MPHTFSQHLIAIALALGISILGQATVMTSAFPGPQETARPASPATLSVPPLSDATFSLSAQL